MRWLVHLLVELTVWRVVLTYRPEVDDNGSPSIHRDEESGSKAAPGTPVFASTKSNPMAEQHLGKPQHAHRHSERRGSGMMAVQVWSSAIMQLASQGAQKSRKQPEEKHLRHMSLAKGAPSSVSPHGDQTIGMLQSWTDGHAKTVMEVTGLSKGHAEVGGVSSKAGSREMRAKRQEEHLHRGTMEQALDPWSAEWWPALSSLEEFGQPGVAVAAAAAPGSEAEGQAAPHRPTAAATATAPVSPAPLDSGAAEKVAPRQLTNEEMVMAPVPTAAVGSEAVDNAAPQEADAAATATAPAPAAAVDSRAADKAASQEVEATATAAAPAPAAAVSSEAADQTAPQRQEAAATAMAPAQAAAVDSGDADTAAPHGQEAAVAPAPAPAAAVSSEAADQTAPQGQEAAAMAMAPALAAAVGSESADKADPQGQDDVARPTAPAPAAAVAKATTPAPATAVASEAADKADPQGQEAAATATAPAPATPVGNDATDKANQQGQKAAATATATAPAAAAAAGSEAADQADPQVQEAASTATAPAPVAAPVGSEAVDKAAPQAQEAAATATATAPAAAAAAGSEAANQADPQVQEPASTATAPAPVAAAVGSEAVDKAAPQEQEAAATATAPAPEAADKSDLQGQKAAATATATAPAAAAAAGSEAANQADPQVQEPASTATAPAPAATAVGSEAADKEAPQGQEAAATASAPAPADAVGSEVVDKADPHGQGAAAVAVVAAPVGAAVTPAAAAAVGSGTAGKAAPHGQKAAAGAAYSASGANQTTAGPPPLPDAAKLEARNAGRLIMLGLERQDVLALRSYLEAVGAMLDRDPSSFNPNALVPLGGAAPPGTEGDVMVVGSGSEARRRQQLSPSATATPLAYVARSGWLPGIEELFAWDGARGDKGERLRVDDQGGKEEPYAATPLLLSVEAGHAGAAARLLQRRASVAVRDGLGRTPLEIAAHGGEWEMVAALLESGTVLAGGLMPLRLQMHEEGERLPRFEGRWKQAKEQEDQLERMRGLVPPAFRPTAEEQLIVGDLPASWVLLYKNRVMCAFSNGVLSRGKPAHITQMLLAAHDFNSFARDFSLSCAILSCMLGAFGLLTYAAFRLRLYGWCDAPVSLAEHIPGAYDPLRLAEPDFDPARQKTRLPYLRAKEYLGPQVLPCPALLTAFVQAWLGIFSSWLLLCVRIPPEKDPYDEDYLSEDDEDCRAKVREQCLARAAKVRCWEVSARALGFLALTLWLVLRAQRWGEAAVLLLLYCYHAWLASSVAGSTVPAPPSEPEKTPSDSDSLREEALDSARVVHALFSVQQGPRWTRSVSSTRSTAAPNSSTKARWLRRRNRRQHQQPHPNGFETDRSASEAQGPAGDVPGILEADETAFSDWFQRTFLQHGLLHVSHGALLANSAVSIVLIFSALLWLAHGRRLCGEWLYLYAWAPPTQLFEAYGAPGSWERCVAISLELLLLFFAGERIYGMAGLLNVGALTLEQRRAALRFARRHQPAVCRKTPGEALSVRGASVAVDECVRCFDFALELSDVRWAVLREPTLVLYLFALKFLLAALVLMAAPLAQPASASWIRSWSALDPMVPLMLGLCLAWPLLGLLFAAAAANREVAQQREHIRQATDAAVALAATAGKEADDVQYVQLRVKSCDALHKSFIRWPGGRLLSLFEPMSLLILLTVTLGLAFSTGLGA